MVKRVAYIIPGYRENIHGKSYRALSKHLISKKISPIFISIHWKNRTMTSYVRQFLQQINLQTEKFYIIGFSYGAMMALIASALLKPERLYLCSLSPYFKEDVKKLSISDYRLIGKKRAKDFNNYSFHKFVKKISCKTFLFAGTDELPSVLKRSKEAVDNIKGSRFASVRQGTHKVDDTYLHAILNKI